MREEQWFADLAQAVEGEESGERAPSCLKSRLYTRLIREQQADAPLVPLAATHAAGRGLCVFEHLVRIMPLGMSQTHQYCELCHARVAGERIENAPIFWPNCPYCEFQNR